MKSHLVIIIISNYNGASIKYKNKSILDICLDSIKNTKYDNYKILITDDCSTDNSVNYLKSKYPNIDILKSEFNGGFSRNNNNGIKYAMKKYNPEYILLLNNDIIIKNKFWLKSLVDTALSEKNVGLVGCKLLFPNKRIQFSGYKLKPIPRYIGRFELDTGDYDKIREVDGITGALMLIKRDVIKKVGLLDENLYMGFDDADYSIRVKSSGFKCLFNGHISATHIEGTSTIKQNKNKRFFLVQVGFIYFSLKHLNLFERILIIFFELGGSLFSIENEKTGRSFKNLHLNNNFFERFLLSLKAIPVAYKIYAKKEKIEKYLIPT